MANKRMGLTMPFCLALPAGPLPQNAEKEIALPVQDRLHRPVLYSTLFTDLVTFA